MIIVGIDPGSIVSGVTCWDSTNGTVYWSKTIDNITARALIEQITPAPDLIAIERIRGFGLVSGDSTFDTCEWIGRFEERANLVNIRVVLIPRKDIKKHLCGNTTTNDKFVREALIDRIGPQGTKKAPGPTFGVSGHCWSALAVAVVAGDMQGGKP